MRRLISIAATLLLLATVGVIAPASSAAQTSSQSGARGTAAPIGPKHEPYTFVKDVRNLSVPSSTRRVALLIGNDAYDAIGNDTANPSHLSLGELTTPCSDVKLLADKLSSIGWATNEIFVLCDQTTEQVRTAIGKLLRTAPVDPADARLMMLYLSGHGMNIEQKNYFFGIDTRLDLPEKAQLVFKVRKTRQQRKIFQYDEAIDLSEELGQFGGETGNLNFPLLIVLDACRNNPLAGEMRKAYAKLAPADQQPFVGSPLPIGVKPPSGLQIVYATKTGNTVIDNDGSGHSRLAGKLADKLAPNVPIQFVLQETREAILDGNEVLAPAEAQIPDFEGALVVEKTGGWCFYGCIRPGSQSASISPATISNAGPSSRAKGSSQPLLRPASFGSSQARDDSAPVRSARTLARFETGENRAVTLDIFWCSVGQDGAARHDRATAFGDALVKHVQSSNPVFGKSQLATINLREFSAAENERPGYRRREDALYVDPNELDREENRLAATLIKPLAPDLKVRPTSSPTPRYVSVFFCNGAYVGPDAPRVYVQVPRDIDLPIGSKVVTLLGGQFPNLAVEPIVERMLDGANAAARVQYPVNTEVRYSRADMGPNAEAVARTLEAYSGVKVRAYCLKTCPDPHATSNIEVWIGSGSASEAFHDVLEPFSAVAGSTKASRSNQN